MLGNLIILGVDCVHPGLLLLSGVFTLDGVLDAGIRLCRCLRQHRQSADVVILIIQIAGSGGSSPIELLPNFFQQVYLFFPSPTR